MFWFVFDRCALFFLILDLKQLCPIYGQKEDSFFKNNFWHGSSNFSVKTEPVQDSGQRPSTGSKVLAQRSYISAMCFDSRRLGNLMFNYASLLGIAEFNHLIPVMPIHGITWTLADHFQLKILRVDTVEKSGKFEPFVEHRTNAFDPKSLPIDLDSDKNDINKNWNNTADTLNIMLHGFYQSWRYFENIETLIRENFQFKEQILDDVLKFWSVVESLRNGGTTGSYLSRNSVKSQSLDLSGYRIVRIGIHVRRGDCLSSVSNIEYGYTIANKNYFERAIRYMATKLKDAENNRGSQLYFQFVVCSDDVLWSYKNVVIPSLARDVMAGIIISIVYSENNSAEVDLGILSQCHHVIMSTGTFGWWAGWLAGGYVVYFKDFPRGGSKLDGQVNKMDYFPAHWVAL